MDFWGYDNLKRWSEVSLLGVDIPQSSKRFLTEVGLPHREDWTLRFDPRADQFPRLQNMPNCRRIGFDDLVPICLDEEREGRVVAVGTEIGGPVRFINSGIEYFGEFLVLYEEYRRLARAVDEEQILKVIPAIEKRMRAIDPKAFEEPDNFWPVVIEQMNAGLL